MAWLSQILAVTWVNLRSLPQRLGSALVAVVGIAGVVAVFLAVLSIAAGFRAVMTSTGSPRRAIVLRAGSDTEMSSFLSLEETRIIANAPGVARGPEGPRASAELFVVVDLPKRGTGTDANVPLRGLQPAGLEIRQPVEILEGRRFEPGRNELIAGVAAAREFEGLEVGSVLALGANRWKVVGIFSTGGTVADSELWCDASVLQPAYRRGSTFQSLYAELESPAAFERFEEALTSDVRLDVQVERETDYFAAQSRALTELVGVLGGLVAVIMGIGATFGALNTMYSAVAARAREIATLRALGFGPGPVVVSVLAEALVVALAGGLIGGGLAYLGFNGHQTSTINWQSFSQVAFAFRVGPDLLVRGIVYAAVMGLIGGFFPALRAARLPVAQALRES